MKLEYMLWKTHQFGEFWESVSASWFGDSNGWVLFLSSYSVLIPELGLILSDLLAQLLSLTTFHVSFFALFPCILCSICFWKLLFVSTSLWQQKEPRWSSVSFIFKYGSQTVSCYFYLLSSLLSFALSSFIYIFTRSTLFIDEISPYLSCLSGNSCYFQVPLHIDSYTSGC